MQTKLLPHLSPPSPSPNPNNPADSIQGYSLKFQHFLFILVIIFLVFISCDTIWHKLIEKLNDGPSDVLPAHPISLRRSEHLGISGGGSSTIFGAIPLTPMRPQLPPTRPRPSPPPPPVINEAGQCDHGGRVAANTCSECVICLKEFRYIDLCRVLPDCHHTFHASCIDGWIMINQSCPICRSSVQAD